MKSYFSVWASLLVAGLFLCVGLAPANAQHNIGSVTKAELTKPLTHKHQHKHGVSYMGPVPMHRNCAFDKQLAWQRRQEGGQVTEEQYEQAMKRAIARYKLERNSTATEEDEVIVIPIIVHVVHNGEEVGVGANISKEQVDSQIEVLNEDFRRTEGTNGFNDNPVGVDSRIEFVPAVVDPAGDSLAEPGIHRYNGGRTFWTQATANGELKPNTSWDPDRYLNVWTLAFGGEDDGTLGYAQFPSLSGLPGLNVNGGSRNTDGVVIGFQFYGRVGNVSAPFNLGRTTTHEIGHFLGLRHIWGDGGCGVDDFCEDTPLAGSPNFGCPNSNTCSTSPADMKENYMDYTNDACMNIFTQDQLERMMAVLTNSPRRISLPGSLAGNPLALPTTRFDASQRLACPGTTIELQDRSAGEVQAWNWSILTPAGDTLATTSEQNPAFTFGSGSYTVSLITQNVNGFDTLTRTDFIQIFSDQVPEYPYAEDLENAATALPGWTLGNPDEDRTWVFSNSASGNGVGQQALVMDNYSEGPDPSGTQDVLYSPYINLDLDNTVQLSFDVAYAPFNNNLADTLGVFYSTNCGDSFVPLYLKGNTNLATAPATTDAFIPTASQWRTENISLADLQGQDSIIIAFVNFSGYGNLLWLDNIRLDEAVGNIAPVADFVASQSVICEGQTITFADQSQNFPSSWQWSFEGGDAQDNTVQNPSVTYFEAGTYEVVLTVTNASGTDTETKSAFITVEANPVPDITIQNNNGCQGETFVLSATGAATYQWFADTTLLGNSSQVTLTPESTFTARLIATSSAGCTTDTTVQVTVTPIPPAPSIIPFEESIFGNSIGVGEYQWLLDGQPLAGETGLEVVPQASGVYTLQFTNAQGCRSLSNEVVFQFTGIEEVLKGRFSYYPNPAQGTLNVNVQYGGQGTEQLLLADLSGKVHIRRQLQPSVQAYRIDISNMTPGVYVLTYRTPEGSLHQKLVVR